MHIAILEAGRTNPDMPAKFPNYPEMFETLFSKQINRLRFRFSVLPVIDSVFPKSINEYDGYLVTGSAYGVYDNVSFIPRLMDLIYKIYTSGKPIVGICFGHQILAQALGGNAKKHDHGWGIGTMPIEIVNKVDWIPSEIRHLNVIHVHQDQVIDLPPNAIRLAKSDFCKNAAFVIEKQVLAIQGHPEFTAEYTNALINIRQDKIGKQKSAEARISLKKPHDGVKIGGWILDFFVKNEPE